MQSDWSDHITSVLTWWYVPPFRDEIHCSSKDLKQIIQIDLCITVEMWLGSLRSHSYLFREIVPKSLINTRWEELAHIFTFLKNRSKASHVVYMLQVKIKFRSKFFNLGLLGWFSICFVSYPSFMNRARSQRKFWINLGSKFWPEFKLNL